MTVHDDAGVREHTHDEYLTEDDLKGKLSFYAWIIVGVIGSGLFFGLIYVLGLSAQQQQHVSSSNDRMLSTEQRVTSLETGRAQLHDAIRGVDKNLDSLRFEIRNLVREIERAR